MIQYVTLHQALPDPGSDAAPPDWLHLVPAGEFRGNDGRGPYRLTDPAAVIARSVKGGKLVLDENHATDLLAPKGGSAPAQGWIVELQARDDGIWGRVDWNPPGRLLMQNRAYRGISPAIQVNAATGQVLALLRASLVNNPNLPQLTTLHSQQEPGVDPKKLRAALGLPEDADDAAVLAAAEAARTAVSTHAQQLQRIATAAGVEKPAEAGTDAIVTVLNARVGETDVAKLRETIVSLQSQVTTLENDGKKARAIEVVDAAIRDGKPIKPLREDYIARHMREPEQVEKELKALVSLHHGGIADRKAGQGSTAGDPVGEEARIIALMGIDPAAFKKARAAETQEIL
ncbi:phage protease [Roseomonas sp. HJA6]|uniref:Phage protease n=1 Tax=Roseomonas alba TaxID=2846776 RepID=A0ABS7AIC8_9PROT|nr:phage protease [Neoroseomonas alba]MBW6402074.1 phage protease [Neoroseomonas alba]